MCICVYSQSTMFEINKFLVHTWLMAPSVFIVDDFGCRLRNTVTESQSDDIFSPKIFENLKTKTEQSDFVFLLNVASKSE